MEIELHPDEIEDHPSTPSHPAGKVTAFDEHSGLPIVRRHDVNQNPTEAKDHAEKAEKKDQAHDGGKRPMADEVGKVHSTGRDVLHQSSDREELVKQAKSHSKQFEDGIKSATRGIQGAHFDAVRDEKNPARVDEKIKDENQPIETIPDILAGRIGVDSHEAHEKTAKAIGSHFNVVRDEDEFKDGDPEYGYRVHKMQVQVTPQLSGEVHIVPKEVLEVNDKEHQAYKDSRDAETEGDTKDAAKEAAKAKAINDAAMAKFEARQSGGKMDAGGKDAEKEAKKEGVAEPVRDNSSANRADSRPDSKDGGGKPAAAVSGDGSGRGGVSQSVSRFPSSSGRGMAVGLIRGNSQNDGMENGAKGVTNEDAAKVRSTDGSAGASRFNRAAVTGNGNRDGRKPDSTPPQRDSQDSASGSGGRTDKATVDSANSKRSVSDAGDSPSVHGNNDRGGPKLARGQTVLIGDSHGIIRGGNPNFASGGRWSVETPEGTKTVKGSELTAVQSAKAKDQAHIAVDLDKTLAEMKGPFKGPTVIGKPIPEMVDRVKKMLADGEDVRIFTARVSDDPKSIARAAIEAWLHKNIGQSLPITDKKDHLTTKIYDDRAVGVVPNTGKLVGA